MAGIIKAIQFLAKKNWKGILLGGVAGYLYANSIGDVSFVFESASIIDPLIETTANFARNKVLIAGTFIGAMIGGFIDDLDIII